jgi:hypothetical protein
VTSVGLLSEPLNQETNKWESFSTLDVHMEFLCNLFRPNYIYSFNSALSWGLALISLTSNGRLVGIARLRTKTMEVFFLF